VLPGETTDDEGGDDGRPSHDDADPTETGGHPERATDETARIVLAHKETG
jgi:hypothetical protein